jgi:signal peptidase I
MSKNDTNDSEQKKKKAEEPGLLSSTISLFIIIFVVFAFKSSILDANNIPSGSMLPTLKIGDFLFVNKMRYSFRMPFSEGEIFRYDNPKRGDIVTFIPPDRAGLSRCGTRTQIINLVELFFLVEFRLSLFKTPIN